jgi:hypothetical protein
MASDKDRKSEGNFINKPQEGRKWRHGGAYCQAFSHFFRSNRGED